MDEVKNAQVEVKGEIVQASYQPESGEAKVPATPEEMQARLEAIRAQVWNSLQMPHRQKLAKKLGVEVQDVEMEGDTLKYHRLAFNKHGLLAMPKGHGRSQPRIKASGALLKAESISTFHSLFHKMEDKVKAALPEGEKFEGLTQEQIKDLGAISTNIAARRLDSRGRVARKQARKRHRDARRVGFGTLAGNRARNIHSQN